MKIDSVKLGSLLVFLAIALGAFGAHALKDVLSPRYFEIFKTGVQYQMYNGLGLLAISALARKLDRAKLLMFIGALIFSGSLYLLAFTGIGLFGAITPIGGVVQLAAWALVFFGRDEN